ncbi:MAG TPA: aminotransferase class V-fold PLP-dependent enzyme [Gemmatimonadaceae bacterium]|jgi:selenocysteine lyase/cysteine desulfurase|nr:aminotransferase class V-fold PLP-dependent enzyme [Gemmatimonadota bacterium]HPV77193.1 aminotransferase class V-fold PLP-dependent enzyme [Gemmatimonadaceae bacterium]
MQKRDFLRTLGGVTLGAFFAPGQLARYARLSDAALAEDEPFWAQIRAGFRLTPEYINLENGYFCLQPTEVLEAFISRVREINLQASRYMRTRQGDDKLAVRTRLAQMAGCSPEELIITRNTTESLDTVIAGFDWKAGDEAVMAEQDYGAMLDMFKLQARRYGIVNRVVSLPNDPRTDDELVQLYANAITPRTRLLMVSHLVNITGQVLPVQKIAAMAHARGVAVMVDGAHAFAQLDFRIPDLGVDYYGASLHKWLATPLGAGILYVKRDKIAGLWPIYGDSGPADDDIRKLNHTGTHPVHTDLAINHAIDFHQAIGSARKEARLRYLQQYWVSKVHGMPKIILNTPTDPARSCAIANVGVRGIAPGELMDILMKKYRIWTVAIDGAGVHGVRVTPHLFTSTAELDAFVKALGELAA